MNNEEICKELAVIESVIGQGLDSSSGATGLTIVDSMKYTDLRDSAVYALALLKICKEKLVNKEVKSYETKTKKK